MVWSIIRDSTAEHFQRKAHQNDTKLNRNRDYLTEEEGKKRTTFSLEAKMQMHFLIRSERGRTNIP